MSTPKRRSARIASASKSIKAALIPRLGSVIEGEEPSAQKPLEQPVVEEPARPLDAVMSSPPKPSTPVSTKPVKLPMSEMHPSKTHQTMAPPSSGLKLGFIDIYTDRKNGDRPSAAQTTPSKTPVAPSPFTFRVPQPGNDLGLSPEARKIQDGLREDAARIRAERAAAKARGELMDEDTDARKIAKPKGKAGRFSEVHMKEFKKMDSIATHWSVVSGRQTPLKQATPLKQGLKRTQSKANLDEPESSSRKMTSARASTRSKAVAAPEKAQEEPESPAKRVRQRIEDDASSSRPVSRDGSQIPRPNTVSHNSVRTGIPRSKTLASLMTPTKASAAKTLVAKAPTISLVKSPSKPELGGSLLRSPTRPDLSTLINSPSRPIIGSGLKKSATVSNLEVPKAAPSLIQTPGRFDRVKSILKRQFSASKPKSNLPQLAGAPPKTPGRTEKEPAAVPMTTPAQKFGKHVEFTPDTKQATMSQNSPSPVKSNIPRSNTTPKIPTPHFGSLGEMLSGQKNSAKKDTAEKEDEGQISYPDLSAYEADLVDKPDEDQANNKPEPLPQSVPGTFTFRSDHTIRFDNASPKGFGGSAGQASLRQVRPSVGPSARMPGSFPNVNEPSTNKENKDPAIFTGIPHGMSSKKRARAVWEDDEVKTGISHGLSNKKRHRAEEEEVEESPQRATKKLRKDPPAAEGQANFAPRLAITSPSPVKKFGGVARTPSPQKKKAGISLSRLNMLARPKNRK